MELELVPIADFYARLKAGWTMLANYPLHAGDYAVVMQRPAEKTTARSNLSRAASIRNEQRAA